MKPYMLLAALAVIMIALSCVADAQTATPTANPPGITQGPRCSRYRALPSRIAGYDQEHLVTYLRLLDADAEGADWREVAAPGGRSIAIWRAPTPLRVLRKIALREPVNRRVA